MTSRAGKSWQEVNRDTPVYGVECRLLIGVLRCYNYFIYCEHSILPSEVSLKFSNVYTAYVSFAK